MIDPTKKLLVLSKRIIQADLEQVGVHSNQEFYQWFADDIQKTTGKTVTVIEWGNSLALFVKTDDFEVVSTLLESRSLWFEIRDAFRA